MWTLLVCVLFLPNSYGIQGFPPTSFTSEWFNMSSDDRTGYPGYVKVPHGLVGTPRLVKVLAKATDGDNAMFVFEATGSQQIDNDSADERGGVIFAYSLTSVYVWVAVVDAFSSLVYPLYVGGTWGNGVNNQQSVTVQIQIHAWTPEDFYTPDFISDWTAIGLNDYQNVDHEPQDGNNGLVEEPVLVKVTGKFSHGGETMYFDGSGSEQADGIQFPGWIFQGGGVLYAYDANRTRIWTAPKQLFVAGPGWGHMQNNIEVISAHVRVLVWRSFDCLDPSHDSDWFEVNQSLTTFHEMSFSRCASSRFVTVGIRVMNGPNAGYIFDGVGNIQNSGVRRTDIDEVVGGVLYAHDETTLRLWMVNKTITPKGGIIAVDNWGGTNYQQISSAALLRVRVWCGDISSLPVCDPPKMKTGSPYYLIKMDEHCLNGLVALNSTAVRSRIHCVDVCRANKMCTAFALSFNKTECHIYGRLQFGNASAIVAGLDVYELSESCGMACPWYISEATHV